MGCRDSGEAEFVFARLGSAEGEGAFSGALDVHDAVVVIEGFLGWGLAGCVVGRKGRTYIDPDIYSELWVCFVRPRLCVKFLRRVMACKVATMSANIQRALWLYLHRRKE